MRRYRNILVGVDGSQSGFHALEEAIRLAQWGKGGVTVIHVAPSYEGDLSLVGVRNIGAVLHGPGDRILREAVEIAEVHDFSIGIIHEEGKVHEKAVRHAMARDVDLIVLGVERTLSIAGFLLGNVVTKVVELYLGDVLAIPRQAPIGWEKILFAFESPKCGRDVAARVIELAVSHGGELRTLSVTHSLFSSIGKVPIGKECLARRDAVQCLESIHMQADHAGVKNEGILRCGPFHRVVGRVAEEQEIDMVIVGSNGRIRPGWGFGRSIVGRIIGSVSCPVLFLRPEQGQCHNVRHSVLSQ